MNILVTGGAGFIGTNLIAKLLKEGHKIICLDNLQTGREKNVSQFKDNENFRLIIKDVKYLTDKDFDEIGKIDRIYNLACPASPKAYQINPIDTTLTCVLGIKNLIALALKNNARLLQSSTSEIYGNALETPQKETYLGNVNPIGPRSCYDEGKRCAESILFDAHRKLGANIRLVRIFNTYGPYMDKDDGRVVSNFIVQALEGKPLTMYGTGEQTRSFCYIDDLLEGLVAVMEGNEVGPYNLGNPQEFTMKQLAEIVISQTNSNSKVIFEPLPIDDPVRRRPDITKAKEAFNFRPKIGLDKGIKNTVQYFQQVLKEEKNG